MGLKDVLRTDALTSIECLDLNELSFYSRQNSGILSDLYDEGVITDEDILTSLRVAVINRARSDYSLVTRKGTTVRPDHVLRPEVLAYAIEEGTISMEDACKIPFDHEKNAVEFCQFYRRENLLEKLKDELLDSKKPSSAPQPT